MKNILFFCITLGAISVRAQILPGKESGTDSKYPINKSLKGNGMVFTQNKGQIVDMNQQARPDVLYKGNGGGIDVYLRKTGISYVCSNLGKELHEIKEQVEEKEKKDHLSKHEAQELKNKLEQEAEIKIHRLDVDFVGANPSPEIQTADQVEGYTNYYYAHCPQGITNVYSYNTIIQKNVYKGVDVKYYGGKEHGLKYDIVVNPGADPHQIKLKYSGAEVMLENEILKVKTPLGDVIEYLPKVYQVINGKIVDVEAKYVLTLISEVETYVNFSVAGYNSSYPLIIDPYWATYFGGDKSEFGTGIATDPNGNVVISGTTYGGIFPAVASGVNIVWQPVFGGDVADAFVAKFNPTGNLLWATFYGGNKRDEGTGIGTDFSGNIVLTGWTQWIMPGVSFPTGASAGNVIWQSAGGGGNEAFIVKFDANGNRLWATLYGGNKWDQGNSIATDLNGNVIITGFTLGGTFPMAKTGVNIVQQATFGGGFDDAFLVKFSPTGGLLWATYCGGASDDEGNDIATDSGGNIVITGWTASVNFPILTLALAYSQAPGGADAFVVKYNTGGVLIWSTYYGGTSTEKGVGIATDYADNIVITGYTFSTDFPVGATAGNVIHQSSLLGTGWAADAIVVKFDKNGLRQWATYYGISNPASVFGAWADDIATDGDNNIFLLMEEEDTYINPVIISTLADVCAWQPNFGGKEDQIIVKFVANGEKKCATYLGGTGEDDIDSGGGIAIFGNSLFITGYNLDGGYPVSAGAWQTVKDIWASDAFVASLCTNICEGKILSLDFSESTNDICPNIPITFTPTVANSCDTTGYKFHWVFTGGNPATSDSVKPTILFSHAGTHDVKLVVTTICKKDSIVKINNITVNSCGCSLSSQTNVNTNVSCNGGNNGSATVVISNGSGGNYTYKWSNGSTGITTATSISVTGLSAGVYTVTISGGMCTSSSTVTIISPPPIIGQFTKGTADCTGCGCKEWIMVNATGGTNPYIYNWPDGYINRYKNTLCPGTYSVNVKDKNGCSIIVNVTAP
ncbi:MAG: SBBP repeat-containing protein [Bacteroidetes bacterium]|nr:SBBP repeat-containing protein [Bacteroidota bacterium]